MKILYLGIAVWPSWEIAKQKMWIWLKSTERFGFDFKYYGVGIDHWPGYRHQKVETQLEWLKSQDLHEYTHILYTDCADCLMLGPPSEIEEKYKEMGEPPVLLSAAHYLGNVSDGERYPVFEQTKDRYRYPCCGGYLMEKDWVFKYLQTAHDDFPDVGDDCFILYDMIQSGWLPTVMDTGCQIWQLRDLENCEVQGLRLRNRVTGTHPSLLHMSGGYASQENFKDDMMTPVAKMLGVL
jgi:hypothetical protein